MKRFKMFFINHYVLIIIIFVVVALGVFTVFGLSKLESFYRNMTLATLPLQLLMVGLNAVIFAYLYMVMFRGGLGQMKKSRVRIEDINILFKDVIGLENAKKEAMEVVALLKDRARVRKIGGKIIKGLLLVGPPGCGKTLLAKAIATEANIPFMTASGSEFVEIFVGVGASRVRKLFKKARQLAYVNGACIIFLDELEVIGRGRTFSFMGAGEETNSTQNQLLVEMDGLENSKSNVVVIGATNAEENVLDKALLRPGRFDRKIYISKPNLKERIELFNYYLKKVKHNISDNIERFAKKSVGKSPADIENIIREAALIASRHSKDIIEARDITMAMDRIELGVERGLELTLGEKEMVAFHEAGHTAVLYFLHPSDDVFKASIISRGGALGMVVHHPKQELYTHSKEKLLADIMVNLAGYASEKIKYNTTSTGVHSDFQNATTIAHSMVWELGMSRNNMVGNFMNIPAEHMSNEMKHKLNEETMAIINKSLETVDVFLRKNWAMVEKLAAELIRKGELDFDEIEAIFKSIQYDNKELCDGLTQNVLPGPESATNS